MIPLLLSLVLADASCRNVWDQMNSRWVFVCTAPSDVSTNPPTCKNVYDPLTDTWPLVCDGQVQH